MNAINAMAENYGMPVIYSMHPRSKKYIEQRNFKFHKNVKPLPPFGFADYNNLQLNAYCVVSEHRRKSQASEISKPTPKV